MMYAWWGRELFVVETHNVICDKIATEISTRSAIYKMVLNHFELFFNHNMTYDEINKDILKLADEVHQFLKFIKEENIKCPFKMYKIIIDGL